MVSKSTKQKQRQHANFYKLTKSLKVSLIDKRDCFRFYLISLQINASKCIHIEARSDNLLKKYREMLAACRSRT